MAIKFTDHATIKIEDEKVYSQNETVYAGEKASSEFLRKVV